MSLMMLLQLFVPADKMEPITRCYCRVQLWLTGTRVRYVVSPKLEADQTYFFCQNHVNLLDHVTIYSATPHFKQGIELASHFSVPFYGWFMKQRGTLGIYPGKQQMRQLQAAIQNELHCGHSILFFPEGGRTLDGQLKPFKPGLFAIAQTLNVEIVPVVVRGMYQVLRKGDWHLTPFQHVEVIFGDPVRVNELPGDSLNDKVQSLRQAMSAVLNGYEEKPCVSISS
jgi:1-acyl-sn-glycerol-3-phosphate acyltransferase